MIDPKGTRSLPQGLRLSKGSHKSITDGACVTEAVGWLAGEPWSDTPDCMEPRLASILRTTNDHATQDVLDLLMEGVLDGRFAIRDVRVAARIEARVQREIISTKFQTEHSERIAALFDRRAAGDEPSESEWDAAKTSALVAARSERFDSGLYAGWGAGWAASWAVSYAGVGVIVGVAALPAAWRDMARIVMEETNRD